MSSRLTRQEFAARVARAGAAIGLAGLASAARRATAAALTDRLLFRWPVAAFQLGARPVSVAIGVRRTRKQLLELSEDATRTLLLRLDGVEAAKPPGVVWQVYVSAPGDATLHPTRPPFVGNLVLIGPGIRPRFKPARLDFVAGRAVHAALAGGAERLRLTFVATGPLVDGKPSPPRPAAKVKVATVSFVVRG